MNMPGIAQGFVDQGESLPDNLIAGEFPRSSKTVTVTGGVLVKKGSVLGRIDANGLYKTSDAGAGDGSQVPDAILMHDVDVTAGDVKAHVYLSGEFNAHALILGAGHSIESVTTALRSRSIFIKANQP